MIVDAFCLHYKLPISWALPSSFCCYYWNSQRFFIKLLKCWLSLCCSDQRWSWYPLPVQKLGFHFSYLTFSPFILVWNAVCLGFLFCFVLFCMFPNFSGILQQLIEKKLFGVKDLELRSVNIGIFVQEWKCRPYRRLHSRAEGKVCKDW